MPIVPRLCTHSDNANPYAHAARFISDRLAARLRWRLACLRLAPYLALRTETPAFCRLYAPGDPRQYVWSARRAFHHVHVL